MKTTRLIGALGAAVLMLTLGACGEDTSSAVAGAAGSTSSRRRHDPSKLTEHQGPLGEIRQAAA